MSQTLSKLISDQWIKTPWKDYLKITETPNFEQAKFYYYQGQFRVEMSPLGNRHARDYSIINTAINLYAILTN
ncbi:hypothetical protein PN462_12995 [Spirulina sp. CS-785/01]|uniref:hypothetical protein n=1 Tax=Spirulina sp. CS-785/01 TaxID=3021716 RepID=UPI00233011B9|nr:hypothetical protein [Spirulina sp. CS-785/01]MDB9314023.1 hypothetical protein [Spirulina sp. CS-785/01]